MPTQTKSEEPDHRDLKNTKSALEGYLEGYALAHEPLQVQELIARSSSWINRGKVEAADALIAELILIESSWEEGSRDSMLKKEGMSPSQQVMKHWFEQKCEDDLSNFKLIWGAFAHLSQAKEINQLAKMMDEWVEPIFNKSEGWNKDLDDESAYSIGLTTAIYKGVLKACLTPIKKFKREGTGGTYSMEDKQLMHEKSLAAFEKFQLAIHLNEIPVRKNITSKTKKAL